MKQQEFVKLLIKDHYDAKDDLVSRPLIRAFKKLDYFDVEEFSTNSGIYLYGYKINNKIYELFTNQIIHIDTINCICVDSNEVMSVMEKLDKLKLIRLYLLIKKFVFGEKVDIDFIEVSTIEEKARDRKVLFDNYNAGLTEINPYDKSDLDGHNKSIVERVYRK